jgi:hypothetical protein
MPTCFAGFRSHICHSEIKKSCKNDKTAISLDKEIISPYKETLSSCNKIASLYDKTIFLYEETIALYGKMAGSYDGIVCPYKKTISLYDGIICPYGETILLYEETISPYKEIISPYDKIASSYEEMPDFRVFERDRSGCALPGIPPDGNGGRKILPGMTPDAATFDTVGTPGYLLATLRVTGDVLRTAGYDETATSQTNYRSKRARGRG